MGFFRTTLVYNILTVIVKSNIFFCCNLKGGFWKGSKWVSKLPLKLTDADYDHWTGFYEYGNEHWGSKNAVNL